VGSVTIENRAGWEQNEACIRRKAIILLVNLNGVFNNSDNRCLIAFNICNMETIKSVLKSAEIVKTDIILALSESVMDKVEPEQISVMVNEYVKRFPYNVVLHLDHARNFENIKRVIDVGFTSVMYDGSALAFEENVINTKEVCEFSHPRGVSVEGELGQINEEDGDGQVIETPLFTSPKKAKEFVKRTGVDALAVSVGNAHGKYKGEVDLKVDLIGEIEEQARIPLVLHGSSGIPEDILKAAVKNGVRKININTNLSCAAIDEINRRLNDCGKDKDITFVELMSHTVEVMKQTATEYLNVFSV